MCLHRARSVRPAGRRGFTLLEALLACIVIVIALLGLAATLSYISRSDMSAQETSDALNAARAEIETLRATSFAQLAALANTEFAVTGLRGLNPTGTIQVNTVNPALYDVTVTVSWRGVMGERSLNLRTQIAEQ
ncbi:MAG: prepilin-type N-terminal cleavage/methylation domain-containing protein [Planctomycetes bacterium]|nr:prepilin-type N-terminal cleavage/methylation domain-containing protein [Planctomycetota bacterium]